MSAISAAAVGIPEVEDSLARAHEWMGRVSRSRLAIREPIAEDECRAFEASWRANAAQAVVELRMAAVNLRSAPVDSLKTERRSRIAGLFPILGVSLAIAGFAVFGVVRQRRVSKDSRAKQAANPVMPSMVDSAALVALHYSREAVMTLDPALRILNINPAAERLFGYRAAQLMGVNLQSLVPSLALRGEIPDTSTREPSFETAMHSGGRQIPIEISLHLSDRQGRRLVVALAREAAATEAALPSDTSAAVIADMAVQCPAPMVIYDAEGRIIHVNGAFAETMNADVDEIQNQHYWRTFLTGENAERARREWLVASIKLPDRVQQVWRAFDGRHIPMTWARSAMRDERGGVRFVVAIGVEDQHTEAVRSRAA